MKVFQSLRKHFIDKQSQKSIACIHTNVIKVYIIFSAKKIFINLCRYDPRKVELESNIYGHRTVLFCTASAATCGRHLMPCSLCTATTLRLMWLLASPSTPLSLPYSFFLTLSLSLSLVSMPCETCVRLWLWHSLVALMPNVWPNAA